MGRGVSLGPQVGPATIVRARGWPALAACRTSSASPTLRGCWVTGEARAAPSRWVGEARALAGRPGAQVPGRRRKSRMLEVVECAGS